MTRNLRDFRLYPLVFLTLAASAALALPPPASPPPPGAARTMAEILAAAPAADWREPDPESTLYLELQTGRVVIELAPRFAPLHVANIKKLVRARYFDGLGVIRVQDNYVAQWGDPSARHPLPPGIPKVAPEFDSPLDPRASFTPLPDGDVYAPEAGFTDGFPSARSSALQRTWLAHCYGMVGVGRDEQADSGSGAELYVVIGHSPRHLDRNVALVGRVLQGVELFSTLPRGTKEMGFYGERQTPAPLKSVRVAADMAASERVPLQVLRTDSAAFYALMEARRNRSESWFKVPAGKIELCNVPLPVRESRQR